MSKRLTKREFLILSAVLLVSIALIYYRYLFGGLKYFIGYDTKNEQIGYYTEIRNLIYNGELPFWTHRQFLGGNFWASKSFYLTGDVFTYVTLLFPFLEVIDAMFVVQLIKFVICYFGMYFFLDRFDFSFISKLAGSLVWTFSSWIFMFYGMSSFASVVVFIPFFFSAIEDYLKDGKIVGVFLMSFLIVSANFYLFWTLSFFLLFYWPCRYFISEDDHSFISFIKDSLYLVLIYALGVALAAPLLISSVMNILGNRRVGTDLSALGMIWESKKIYLNILLKFLSNPAYVNKNLPTMFDVNYYRYDQIAVYTSSAVCLLLPQYFVVANKRQRIVGGLFFTGMGLSFICPLLCSAFHGFSEPSFRWTLFLTFVLIVLFCFTVKNIDRINRPLMLATLGFYLLFLAATVIYFKGYSKAPVQTALIIYSAVLLVIYTVCIFYKKKLIPVLVVLETLSFGCVSNYLLGDSYQDSYNYEMIPDGYFSGLSDSDEFYRIYIADAYADMDYVKDFNYNAGYELKFNSVYSYDSSYQASMSPLLEAYNQYFWWFRLTDQGILNTISTKYFVGLSEDDFDQSADLRFVEKIGDSQYSLFENLDYEPFGFTNNYVMSYEEFACHDQSYKDLYIRDNLIVGQRQIDDYRLNELIASDRNYLENVNYSSSFIEGDISTDTTELLFLSVPNDPGWKIYCDGEQLDIIEADLGFMTVLVPAGQHHITMRFVPYGLGAGVCVSLVTLAAVILLEYRRKKSLKYA